MTASLGWTLAQVPAFLTELVRSLGLDPRLDTVSVALQESESTGGITDIELYSPSEMYVVIEAKCGWALPKEEQLERYARRKLFASVPTKRIVIVSECSSEYVRARAYPVTIMGVPVAFISWRQIVRAANDAESNCGYVERRLVRDLTKYLRGVTTMQNHSSNWVYVVSLGTGKPATWDISWIDIVTKKERYFHPVGTGGWPYEPPNYIAFRYRGRLQSIHHVEDYAVIQRPHMHIPEISPDEEWTDHFLYTLGPPFGPSRDVLTGSIWPSGRVWCMLDTLFTCGTVAAARDLSQKREAGQSG